MKRMPLFFVVVVLGACGGKPETDIGPEQLVVYPPPPDTARIQFLTSISAETDFREFDRSFMDRLLGRAGDTARAISRPYGLDLHAGKIYVCDEDVRGLDVVDLDAGTIDFFQPEGHAAMRRAVNCFVDDAGTIYVTDTGRKEVLVYDHGGAYLGSFAGDSGSSPGDVFVDRDRIYVSQLGAGKGIQVFDRVSRQLLFRFPDVPATDSAGLTAPVNIFVARDKIYASDLLKQRIFVYDTAGEFLHHIGRPGTGPSTFSRPKGIAVDREGLVYVVDAAFENVQVFTSEGRLLMTFGGPGYGPGDMVLPAKVVIDYDHLEYFRPYLHSGFELKHLILVSNQYGPEKINVYGFVGPSDYVIPEPDPVSADQKSD